MAGVLATGCAPKGERAIPEDREIEAKVEKVLSGMTLRDKAGQIVQMTVETVMNENGLDEEKLEALFRDYRIGSILNVPNGHANSREYTADFISRIQEKSFDILGTPCLYGLDMIHGATYLTDGTYFPQEINLAATFDPAHATRMGEAQAYETRAAQCPWVFSPVMDLGRDCRWPRMWESFGEDPYLQSVMASAETVALQGEDPNHIDHNHVAVSIKHFMGYGVPHTGKDRTPAYIAENDLREKYFAPFLACLREGALTIMVNSASINGIPTHANKTLLTGWVKEELGWDGMIVTDWGDVDNLFTRDRLAADKVEAVAMGLNAGIDMIMDPYDPGCVDAIEEAVKRGLLPVERVDDAVRRILRLKFRLDLFDNPVTKDEYPEFASDKFKADAYRAAVESEVLLKNEDGILPLSRGTRILVTGPNADNLRAQSGGWSYTWQGDATKYAPEGTNTFLDAIKAKFQNVSYIPGVEYYSDDWQADKDTGIARAAAAAKSADVVIAVVGENSYCETPGNMDDLNLSENQKNLVKAVAASGKSVILVLNEGRPRIIGDIEPLVKAVVDVMLPSNYGGDALAALLAGEENFSGKLPFTYSKHINALHTYDYKVSEHRDMIEGAYNYDAIMDVQWPFGYGLSYTTFEYSDLALETPSEFTSGDTIALTLKVTNTGDRAGREAVLLYSSDLVASLIPDVKRLRAFTKIDLEPGQSETVRFEIPASALAFVGADGKWRLEKGDFRLSAGPLSTMVKCTETKIWETPNI